MGVTWTRYHHEGPKGPHHTGNGQSAYVVLLRLGRQYLLLIVPESVLYVDPHDQGSILMKNLARARSGYPILGTCPELDLHPELPSRGDLPETKIEIYLEFDGYGHP